ncbi:MAG: hypothetical protein HQL24_02740 [Candidatus Omnitrophica bacterium]|nr:hypothetical protein [Candidatus Omnitrophota bacterium]
MRMLTVMKVIGIILGLVLMVFFIFENTDPVTIWIPLFKGRHIGLIYIIWAAYLLGMLNAFWIITLVGARLKKKRKMEAIPEGEEVLFQDEE